MKIMSVKKILASVLLVCMVLSLGSVAFAAETDCDHAGEFVLASTLKPATCESAGVGKYVCAKCGEYYEYRSIAATHDWVETGKTEPECGVAATVSYECSICGATKTEDVPDTALKHVMEKTGEVKGCCTDGTLQEELVCANGCGRTTWKASKVTECTWVEIGYVDATCTEKSGIKYECSVCGAIDVDDSDLADNLKQEAFGHKWSKDIVIEGNCKVGDTVYQVCTVCGIESEPVVDEDPNGTHDYVEDILREATCEGGKLVAGLKKVTCTVCGDVSYESIKASHSYGEAVVTKEPTCTEAGVGTKTCTVCGNVAKANPKALGHSEDTIEIPATCETAAGTVIGCKRCGDEATIDWNTWKVVGPALGHDYDYSKAVKVTVDCKAGKTTEEYKCTRCDAVDTVVIEHAAKGHASAGEALAKNDDASKVDCYTGTGEQYQCLYCGELYWTGTAPTSHKYVTDKTLSTKGTCGTPAETVKVCSNCGDKQTTIGEIDPENHEYSIANEENYTVLREATHDQTGIYYVTCLCGKTTEYVSVPAIPHEFVPDTTDPNYVAPTCTTEGSYTVAYCEGCGEKQTYDTAVTIAMLDHDFITRTVDPTCDKNGAVWTDWCSNCGKVDGKTKGTVIPMLGHKMEATGKLTYDCVAGTVSEATECSVCGAAGEPIVSNFATDGHDWVNEVVLEKATCERPAGTSYECSVCGKLGILKSGKISVSTAKLGDHAYAENKEASVAPTCTTEGKTVEVCSVCGDVKETKLDKDADAHVTEVVSALRAATCTETGVNKVDCTLCDFAGYEATKALGHDMVIVEDEDYVAPTCAKTGVANMACSRCDYTESEVVLEKSKEHTGEIIAEYIKTEATCAKKGTVYINYCPVCKAKDKSVSIDKLDHESATETVYVCTGTWKDAQKVSHTAGVYEVTTCANCDLYEVVDVTPEDFVKGHAYDEGVYVESNCVTDGHMLKTCANCGKQIKDTILDADGNIADPARGDHEWHEEFVPAADCQTSDATVMVCGVCGEKGEPAPTGNMGPHSIVETVIREASCEQPGLTKLTCSVEGCDYSEVIYIDGHTWGTEEIFDEEMGIIYVECTECGAQHPIFSLHNYEYRDSKPASCTEDGKAPDIYCVGVCDVCGSTKVDSERLLEEGAVIPAYGHEVAEWTTTVEPTCQTEGAKAGVCQLCPETVVEKLPVVDHSYGEGEVTTPATCTETGVMTKACVYGCGTTITEEMAVIDHAYDEGVVTTEATCGAAGVLTKTCACGATITEEIAPTGAHVYDEGVVTTEATCDALGEKTYTCDCGATKTEEIPAKGHTYTARYSFKRDDNGNCILNEDGSYIILKTSTCGTCGDVVTEIA